LVRAPGVRGGTGTHVGLPLDLSRPDRSNCRARILTCHPPLGLGKESPKAVTRVRVEGDGSQPGSRRRVRDPRG
jgi:hypothetical protein